MPSLPPDAVMIRTRRQWREWLNLHQDRTKGIWVVTYKQSSGQQDITYDDIVEEAICFGWIDSLGRALDDERTMLWLSPRKKGSKWSALNKVRVEKLERAGLLKERGLMTIQRSKEDGTWTALDKVSKGIIPDDIMEALKEHPPAQTYFEAFPPSVRRGILEWIDGAKRSETRQRRIIETVTLAAKNIRANQWRQPNT